MAATGFEPDQLFHAFCPLQTQGAVAETGGPPACMALRHAFIVSACQPCALNTRLACIAIAPQRAEVEAMTLNVT